MMFPDCRNDDFYNEDFLDGMDKGFLRGFDWAIEMVLDNIFNNLEMITDDSDYLEGVFEKKVPSSLQSEYEVIPRFLGEKETRKINTYADYIRARMLDWAESERDELVTSMIDHEDEDLYHAIRNKVLKDNEKADKDKRKEYYDTRKEICTGKKVYTGPIEENE